MIAPPTLEEAPSSLKPWMNQRTRWMKGHLQTWLVLMRKPFKAMREMGLLRFAATQLTLGGALLASALHAPLLLWLPFGVALGGMEPWQFLLFGIGYASTIAAGLAADRRDAKFIELLSAPLYWPLQSIAMLRALIEMKLRPHFWAKTPHHLADIAPVDIREIAATAPQSPRGDNVIQLEFPFDPPGNAGAR